ncbi:hypothetical protein M513_13522 [Trichuris suis]|uniref:Peptidase S1 domain-containing protein n=1 Tax=Trichuris suis TaxID=68888 RepID=A0A085LKV1_9BILA|nr:hypothetical protein M513_13522 [Trichuris suis]
MQIFRRSSKQTDVPAMKPVQIKVYLGAHDSSIFEPTVQELAATEALFYSIQNKKGFDDIALLILERKVKYSKFIQGICLPSEDEYLPDRHSQCMVTGWGKTGEDKRMAKKLQEVEVELFDTPLCNHFVNTETMFCAGSTRKNVGICEGDSGSPLVCHRNGKFTVYGVMSFTTLGECSNGKDLAVFMRIPAFVNWIKES